MKKLLCAVFVLSLIGCASVQGLVDKFVPKIEIAAGKGGVKLDVNETTLVNSTTLCLESNGKIVSLLNKIPVLGLAIAEVVGVCAPAEEPAPVEQPVN